MKKTIFCFAAAVLAVGMLASCSQKSNDADTAVVEEDVVGEVVEMPAESSQAADTVVATAEAVAVDTAVVK